MKRKLDFAAIFDGQKKQNMPRLYLVIRREENMKKVLAGILYIGVIFLLAACGQAGSANLENQNLTENENTQYEVIRMHSQKIRCLSILLILHRMESRKI